MTDTVLEVTNLKTVLIQKDNSGKNYILCQTCSFNRNIVDNHIA